MSRLEAAKAYLGDCNRPPGDCVLWTGPVDSQGYGVIHGDPRTQRAHVAAYLDSGLGVPRGWHVHHRCETKLCVNPDHLAALSPVDHAREHAPDPVRTLRHVRLERGLSLAQLAEATGIRKPYLSRIECGVQIATREELCSISRVLGCRFWWSILLVDVTDEPTAPWDQFFAAELSATLSGGGLL